MAEHIQDVNIELGDDVSRMLYIASRATQTNRPGMLNERHESFSGFRAIDFSYFNDMGRLCMNLDFDGVGTKVEISERLQDHSAVAHDLFAMACDDAVVRGAEPVALGSILDIRHLEDEPYSYNAMAQLATGYVNAARDAEVVVVNGEVAELGDRIGGYGDFNYNWGAGVLWVAHHERVLTGHQIQAGDSLVGLAEGGFRSNGITDVRKIMQENIGSHWQHTRVHSLGGVSLGKLVQRPSVIYSRFMNELTGGYDIEREPLASVHGAAHITGGGQPSKLGRMLEPSGLGATIDNPLPPPEIMLEVQKMGNYPDRKAYGKWHMGPGMVIATPEPEKVISLASERGHVAQRIGEVTEEPGIRIRNMGAQQEEEYLKF